MRQCPIFFCLPGSLGISLPWLQLAAIVFTANHYIVDALAGLLVCIAGAALALAMQRWAYPAVRAEVERRYGVTPGPATAT